MRALIVLIVVLLLAGSIPFVWGDQGARGERSDPQIGAPPTRGNTIIVDINGNGDYYKIQDAMDSCTEGDIIRIYDGIYHERVTVKKGVGILGNGSSTVVSYDSTPLAIYGKGNIIIEGLTIESNSGTSIHASNSKGLVVKNCIFYGHSQGIYFYNYNDATIIGCQFYIKNPFEIPYEMKNVQISDNNFNYQNEYDWGVIRIGGSYITINDNVLLNVSFDLSPSFLQTYIMDTNSINSLPVLFCKGKSNMVLDKVFSQYFFVNCSHINLGPLVSKDYWRGLVLSNCEFFKIESVRASEEWYAITLFNSQGIYINDTIIDDSDHGIFSDGSELKFSNSSIDGGGSSFFESEIILEDDVFVNSSLFFAEGNSRISGCSYYNTICHIRSNTSLYDCKFQGCNPIALSIDTMKSVILNNIEVNGSEIGIFIDCRQYDYTIGATLSNMTIMNCIRGVAFNPTIDHFSPIIIDNSTIKDCDYGLDLRARKNITEYLIKDCHFEGNVIGINVSGTSNMNLVHDNIFIKNEIGLCLNGTKTKLFGNDLIKNKAGIKFIGYYNMVYGNNFIENNAQIIPGLEPNTLGSYKNGGNYWSDYKGKDQKSGEFQDKWGSDGFGDEPYKVGILSDRFPIVFDYIRPVAIAGEDVVIDEGEYYEFSTEKCTDDNLVMNVEWNFTYEGRNISIRDFYHKFLFEIPGIYQVKLNISDFAGNFDIDDINITVLDIKAPFARSQGNITCLEQSLLFFNASLSYDSGGISKYEWIFDYSGETLTLQGMEASFLFVKPGIVPVTLRVTDSAGHIGEDHFTVTVIDITDPIVEAGDDISIDNGEMATFNGFLSTDNGLIVEYNWTFYYGGQLILLQEIVASYLFEKPGIYNITLEVTDQFGNKASDWLALTVKDTIKPIPIITGLSTFLENENIKLSGKSSTDNGVIAFYVWTIEDNGTVTVEGIDLDYKVKVRGYHKVFLTVFDVWGNNATANLTINAIDSNKPFTAAGPDQEVAVGTTVTMDASGSHDDGTITKYQWTFSYDNQNQELLGKIVSFKFDKPGTYEVTLKVYDDSENNGVDAVTITVKNTGVVKGIVLDDGGKPIDGALVEIIASDGKTYTFTTAPDGSFSLSIPPGSFTWKISKDGYGAISGSSSVDILGEDTLDLAGTPMKKTTSTGTSPILFIVPAVVVILLIVGAVIFLVMRKKKSDPETMEAMPEGEAIQSEPAEGGAPDETALPPEASEFVQAPPIMEEDVPIEKVEENTTVDDLLVDGSDHGDEESLNSEVSS